MTTSPAGSARRLAGRAGRLLGALGAAGILLVALAPAASAHATLLFTAPAADSAVPVSPAAITLTFNEPVTLAGPPVTLTSTGHPIRLGPPRQSHGRSIVTVPVAARLPRGVYTVAWQVISADGDPVNSSFVFAVGPAPATLGSVTAAQPSTPGLWPLAVARWLLFAGLAAALGGLAARALARRRYTGPRPAPLPAPWALRACLLGLAAALALAALQLGGGSLAAGLAHFSVPQLLASGPGKIAAAEAAAFAAAALALRLRRPGLAVLPLLAVVAAEGLRAHPQAIVPGWGALLTVAHLLPAALWAGMLFYVVRAAIAWRSDPAAVRALVRLYAKVAAWLFALVAGTGVAAALVLAAPLSTLWSTSYGRVLLVKAGLVAGAAALAVAGRMWLRHQPAPGAGPALATRVESGTLAAVLAAAGLLVALPAPAAGSQPLPFPPPASGPVVAIAGRAGQTGVYATASAGQLVLWLSPPQYGNEASGPAGDSDEGSLEATATVTLAGPNGQPRVLPVRGCGSGCVVAPARWANGQNLLTLRVSAAGAAGSTVSMAVPWPPEPGARLLRRVTATLRVTPRLTLTERVTSDTAYGLGSAHQYTISGRFFLSQEPYKTGIAPVAVQAPAGGGNTRLLLGYPAQDIWAALTVTPAGQLLAETLTDPDHLITRGFAYPDTAKPGS
jgi:copper transport protein